MSDNHTGECCCGLCLQKRYATIEPQSNQFKVKVVKHDGVTCPRCRHHHEARDNFDHLCDRCIAVLVECYPDHESVQHILGNLKDRGLKPEDNPALHQTNGIA